MDVSSSREDWVTVDGEQYKINVSRTSKTRWMASGAFGAKHLIGKGASYATAVTDWKRQALGEDSPPG
jgi:hypothetical protein